MIVSALAPAKINLGLEILGRRPDGYHEIRTILAAFSLFDRIELHRGEEFRLRVDRSELEAEENLVSAAVRLLQRNVRAITPNIALEKRTPAAAGLGGASSDAAATLSAVDRLYDLGLTDQRLHALAASLGSDVPFFLSGGVALASGRGECLSPMPPPTALFAVVVAPKIEIPAKTATLYGALTRADYSDGSRIERSVRLGRSGWTSDAELLSNAFERPFYELVPDLQELPKLMRRHGATTVGLSGAGPSHYSLETDPARARALGAVLREELQDRAAVFVGRVLDHGVLVAQHASVPESHEWFAQFDHN